MPTDLDHTIADLAQAVHGTRPDAAHCARMATTATAMRTALDALARESLFDTEPANLQTVLDELAGDGKSDR